jgi:hypothetical protein
MFRMKKLLERASNRFGKRLPKEDSGQNEQRVWDIRRTKVNNLAEMQKDPD